MINVLLSMIGPQLTESESEDFARLGEWTVLNERNGRLLVDAIGPQGTLNTVVDALNTTGRDPIVICAWNKCGTQLGNYELNEAAWLAVAPDVIAGHDEQGKLILARPTEYAMLHEWSGWPRKTNPRR